MNHICQPRRAIGETAARVMLALMAGEDPEQQDTILPVELIERASTQAPAGSG
jgi:DNA-binding LacI/PurR family transcriptional regulator